MDSSSLSANQRQHSFPDSAMVGARAMSPGTFCVTTAQLCTTCDVVVTALQSEVTSCAIVELPHAGLAAYSASYAYFQSSMVMAHHTQALVLCRCRIVSAIQCRRRTAENAIRCPVFRSPFSIDSCTDDGK